MRLLLAYVNYLWLTRAGADTKTSMCYWYPKVEGILPMPKTVMLEVSQSDARLLAKGKRSEELCARIKEKANEIGYPLFIRTDLTSHKKDWNNNLVQDEASLLDKMGKLIKYNKRERTEKNLRALVFREYIPLYSNFKDFGGKPVSKERRYYVKDGEVLCHSEGWISWWILHWNQIPKPIKVLINIRKVPLELPADYESVLKEMNTETEDEINLLTEMAKEFSKRVPGHMTVDFAMDKSGEWFLIEANYAIHGWHPMKRCEYHPLWFLAKSGEID